MQNQSRQPLSAHNSSERTIKPEKSFSFIKQSMPATRNSQNPLQDVEAFLQEIDRLQNENYKLKEYASTHTPTKSSHQDIPKQILLENQELKQQLTILKQKLDIQQKSSADSTKQLDTAWKQDIITLKQALEQKDTKHRQILLQEQLNYKQEVAQLKNKLSQLSSSENKNSGLVSVLEQELVQMRRTNNILEDKLQQVIQCFDIQSKDQEFTLLKQQAVISSQESHLIDLRNKLQKQKDINDDLSTQAAAYKESAEIREVNENNISNKLKQVEADFQHVQTTYSEFKESLQNKLEEMTELYSKSHEQVILLQQQLQRNEEINKRLQENYDFEISSRASEIANIQKQKQQLIQFLESELCGFREQNQTIKHQNQKLEAQVKEQKSNWNSNFSELEHKTNMLGEECSRLNEIIATKNAENTQLRQECDSVKLKLKSADSIHKDIQQLDDILMARDEEINILKHQNDSLVVDISKQSDNLRAISSQNKQLTKSAEELKLSNITITELQSKCDIMEKEIERLRQKVLEKSQQVEKLTKENTEIQGKLKSKLK